MLQLVAQFADTTLRGETSGSHCDDSLSWFVNMCGKATSEVMIVDRKTISIMKGCELVGVSRRTIYRIPSGKIEHVCTAGGLVRICVDALWRKLEGASRRQPVGEERRLG